MNDALAAFDASPEGQSVAHLRPVPISAVIAEVFTGKPHTAPCLGCGTSLTAKWKLQFWVCAACEKNWAPFPFEERMVIIRGKKPFHAIMADRTLRKQLTVGEDRLHIPKAFGLAVANQEVTTWASAPKRALVLSGPVGSGKTWQACGALKAVLAHQHGHAHVVNCAGLGRMSREQWNDWSRCTVLALDDLGSRITPAALASAYEIIEHRHANEMATVITSNLDLAGMMALEERIGSRLAAGQWIEMRGVDRRLA